MCSSGDKTNGKSFIFTFRTDKAMHYRGMQAKSALVMAALFGIAPVSVAAPMYGATAAEAEVWSIVERFNEAFEANDVERYFSLVDERITVVTPNNAYRVEGIFDDRVEIEFGFTQGYGEVELWQAFQPHVRVLGDVAVATFHCRGFFKTRPHPVYLKLTNVLVRKDGRWKIAHIHVSD